MSGCQEVNDFENLDVSLLTGCDLNSKDAKVLAAILLAINSQLTPSSDQLVGDGYSVTGVTAQTEPADFPTQPASLTVAVTLDTVTITTPSGSIVVPEGGTYWWGADGLGTVDLTDFVITGDNASSEYTIHWEAV